MSILRIFRRKSALLSSTLAHLSFQLSEALDEILVPVAGQRAMPLSHNAILEADSLANVEDHVTLMQSEIGIWQHLACTPDDHRKNIAAQLLGQMESTTAEGMYLAILRACTLRENDH